MNALMQKIRMILCKGFKGKAKKNNNFKVKTFLLHTYGRPVILIAFNLLALSVRKQEHDTHTHIHAHREKPKQNTKMDSMLATAFS